MKNITFVIADLAMGGAQRVISLLVDRLSGYDGYHVDIIVLASTQQGQSFFSLPPHVRLHYADVLSASSGVVSAVASNFNRITTIRRMIRELRSDVVVTFQTETNCTVLLSALGTGVPVIISERSDPYMYPESRVWRLIRRLVYPLASGAVFQTAYAAGFFGNNIKRHALIFNPVSVVDETETLPAVQGPYILGVGRLSAEKGFDDLIKAHALAQQRMSDFKLVLVGSGPEKDRLESLATSLGTHADVIFAGAQSRLASYYKNALAFVLPSRFEGMPNALIEAMSYGCPVVVTPLYRAAPEIVDHGRNGLIAASGDAAGLSAQIIDIIENNEKRTRLGYAGQADSDRFAGPKIAAQWHDFINSFLK